MENFLRYSKSFSASVTSTRKMGRNRSIEKLELLDHICQELGENYESDRLTVARIQEKLFGLETPLGRGEIGKYVRLVQVSYQWLQSDSKGKQELLKSLSSEAKGSKGYFRLIRFGIECLYKDRINNFEELKRQAKGAGQKERIASSEEPLIQADETIAVRIDDGIPARKAEAEINLGCGTVTALIDDAHAKLDEIGEVLTALGRDYRGSREDRTRYLDEIQELNSRVHFFQDRERVLSRRVEELQAELVTGAEEAAKIQREAQVSLEKLAELEALAAEQKKRTETLDKENQRYANLFRAISEIKANLNGSADLPNASYVSGQERLEPLAETSKEAFSQKINLAFPSWAKFYCRKVLLSREAQKYFASLSKREQRKVVRCMALFFDNDPVTCPASNGKKIEGGMYAGCRELKVGKKRRLLLREKTDSFEVVKIYHKNQSVDNIKE
jgi:hypothetical protein